MSENRRKKNIIRELGRNKTLFGIPGAFCNWYLENPQFKNPVFDYLFSRMITASAQAQVATSMMDLGKRMFREKFDEKQAELETKYVPADTMSKLSPEEIARARKVGLIIGILIFVAVAYLYLNGWHL